MSFNIENLRKVARPTGKAVIAEALYRDENRSWLKKSAMLSLAVERILRERGMSKKDFAAAMGVSPAQVTKILSGKENLCLKTIAHIEDVLEVNLDNVISDIPFCINIKIKESNSVFCKFPQYDCSRTQENTLLSMDYNAAYNKAI